MGAMRAAFAAIALAALALVGAGCGASSASTGSAASGSGAASLVPANADAFVSIDLTKDFPGRDLFTAQFASDLKTVGDELDVAQIGKDSVVFAQPSDEQKFRTLVAKKHATVEKIGDWSVVAASQGTFDRVRAAEKGASLADSPAFRRAWSGLPSDAVARVYAPKDNLLASARADGDALRISATARATSSVPVATSPLLRDVPSGAALAVAFHGASATALLKHAGLEQLAPLLQGDGVLYIRPSGLLPEIAVELASPTPQATLSKIRALLQKHRSALGPIQLTATISAGKVVIADGPSAVAGLRGGPKLVDDGAYKDAVSAAGAPAQTTVFAYGDVTALAPFVELAAQAVTGKPLDTKLTTNLEKLGTVVAWGTRSDGVLRFGAWLRPR